MKELLRTNDPVLLSAIDAVLRSEGVTCFILDTHTSILEGSIGAIPRRVVVDEADHPRARRILEDAEIIEPEAKVGREPSGPTGLRWRR